MIRSSVFVLCTFLVIAGCAPQWNMDHLDGVYHGEKRWAQPEPGDSFPSVKYEVDLVLLADSSFTAHTDRPYDTFTTDYWGEWSLEDSIIRLKYMGEFKDSSGIRQRILFDSLEFIYPELLRGYFRMSGDRELTGMLQGDFESVTVSLQ